MRLLTNQLDFIQQSIFPDQVIDIQTNQPIQLKVEGPVVDRQCNLTIPASNIYGLIETDGFAEIGHALQQDRYDGYYRSMQKQAEEASTMGRSLSLHMVEDTTKTTVMIILYYIKYHDMLFCYIWFPIDFTEWKHGEYHIRNQAEIKRLENFPISLDRKNFGPQLKIDKHWAFVNGELIVDDYCFILSDIGLKTETVPSNFIVAQIFT